MQRLNNQAQSINWASTKTQLTCSHNNFYKSINL